MTIDYWKQLTKLDRKSAIVARGIVDYFNAGYEDSGKLRACQQGALDWGREVGVVITGTSLTSKIGRLLRDAEVFQQFEGRPKHGEGYTLEPGPRLAEFTEWLDNHLEYGMLAKGTIDSDQAKGAVLEQLKNHGAVMLDADAHRVDSKIYKALRDMLNAGQLKVVYVKTATKVAVKTPADDRAHAVDFWNADDE